MTEQLKAAKQISYAIALAFILFLSSSLKAESRVRAFNALYFEDKSVLQQTAHEIDSLAYGESLFLMHTQHDLQALSTLAHATLKSPLTLHPALLQASLASKHGMTDYALESLASVDQTQEQISDLDRMALFQAELAYEQQQWQLLQQSLARVSKPNQLPDPELYYYLQVHSGLASQQPDQAADTIRRMKLSPWRSTSQINLALWHYRQQAYPKGIELLKLTLEELDESVHYSAYDYWYQRGRLHIPVQTPAAHQRQKEELNHLTDKVLSLIGYGYIKAAQQAPDLQKLDLISQAQDILFEIPQSSPYATQGIELMAQGLATTLTLEQAAQKGSLFESNETFATRTVELRQKLDNLLDHLTASDKPLLTQLRSHFISLEITPESRMLNRIESLQQIVQDKIRIRSEVLDLPDAQFQQWLAPLYQTSVLEAAEDTTHLIALQDIPVHQDQLVRWLSAPQTQAYLRTLRFLSQGLDFTEQWQSTKLHMMDNRREGDHDNIQAAVNKLQQAQERIKEAHTALRAEKPLMTDQQANLLFRINRLQRALNQATPMEPPVAEQALNQLRLQKGQLLWAIETAAPMSRQKAIVSIAQVENQLQDIEAISKRLQQPATARMVESEKINSLDRRISELRGRVESALTSNQALFVQSFRSLIESEQVHLHRALLNLQLKQAHALSKSGGNTEND